MLDRRKAHRGRVYYGGRLAFNNRQSTMDCIIRNFSPHGARVEFANAGALPKQMDLLLQNKGVAFLATMIWRRGNQCGFEFHGGMRANQPTLDVALRLRAYERANKVLRGRVEQLRGFG